MVFWWVSFAIALGLQLISIHEGYLTGQTIDRLHKESEQTQREAQDAKEQAETAARQAKPNTMRCIGIRLFKREYGYQVHIFVEPSERRKPIGLFRLWAFLPKNTFMQIRSMEFNGYGTRWLDPGKRRAFVEFTPLGLTKVSLEVTGTVRIELKGNQGFDGKIFDVP